MKRIVLLFSFFISFSFYGQNDTLAVAKVSKISEVYVQGENVLYVGINNRIFINVPNPETLTVISQGLKFENGNYYIAPNDGRQQTLFISFKANDGTIINEEHTFTIKRIPIVMGFINDYNCEKCVVELSKEELKDAVITLKFYNNILPQMKFKVSGFTIMPITKKRNVISVKGDTITSDIFEKLDKLDIGTEFYIWDFKFSHNLGSTSVCKTSPIKIRLVKQ